MASAVVLLSGGMDSVTALYWAQRHQQVVAAISFDYGAKHNHRELPCAAFHCRQLGIPHHTVALPFVNTLFKSNLLQSGEAIPDGHYEAESMKLTVVPFRNGIMLAIAAGFAAGLNAQQLIIAAHAGDHAIYPDCREDFMRHISEAIRLGTYEGITVNRPFIQDRKQDIVRKGVALEVPYAQTWSCYKGGAQHCGVCGTCVERREAFQLAGVADPTEYAAMFQIASNDTKTHR